MPEHCCPRCAHDFVSDAANPACPACGKRAGAAVPRAAFLGIALALAGLLALAAAIVMTRRGSSVEVIDAQQLARDGRRNPEELKRRYHGKTVTLSGVLLAERPSVLPVPGEDRRATAFLMGIVPVPCHFPAASARDLKRIGSLPGMDALVGQSRVRGKLLVNEVATPEKVAADRVPDGLDGRLAQEPIGANGLADALADGRLTPFALHDCRIVD